MLACRIKSVQTIKNFKNLGLTLRTLFCFTKNLRLKDSPLLNGAIQNSKEIIFVVSWRDLIQRAGPFRKQFALESLVNLQQQLAAKNQQLVITFRTLQEFISLEVKNNIQQIVLEEDVNYEEQVQFQNIKKIAAEKNIIVQSSVDSTLTEFWTTLPVFDKENMIFTEFRKKVEKNLKILSPVQTLDHFPGSFAPLQTEYLTTATELRQTSLELQSSFKGGESSAHDHLQSYFSRPEAAQNYKSTRNGMLRFEDSTKFSPWLSLGCLSARTIYSELKTFENNHGSNDSTYWIFFELLWRDYFKYYAFVNKEKLFLRNGMQPLRLTSLPKRLEMDLFKKWKAGATGIDFIDANMLELKETGWMSNRGRQNVASFLVKNQKVDWRLGAYYFEEMLIDYDCASNWGNWSYLAGVGTDPRDRVFNFEKQAHDYDPEKNYVKKWLHSK